MGGPSAVNCYPIESAEEKKKKTSSNELIIHLQHLVAM
jgi:hypothetical protein